MAWLRWLHRYVGLAGSLMLLLMGISGSILVLQDDFWRWQYPELTQLPADLTAEQEAARLQDILQPREPVASAVLNSVPTAIHWPQPNFNAFKVWGKDEHFALVSSQGEVLWQGPARAHWLGWLFELHDNLLLGEAGHQLVGIAALTLTAMIIIGVILWWRTRRRFKWRGLWPAQRQRGAWIISHRDIGSLCSPLLLVLALTGASLVYYQTSANLLTGLLGGQLPAPVSTPSQPVALDQSILTADRLRAALLSARQALPQARLTRLYVTDANPEILRLRFRQPDMWHPNGRSYVSINLSTLKVLEITDANGHGSGPAWLYRLYPLHAAKVGGRVYQALVLLTGLLLSYLAFSGVWSYVLYLRSARQPGS